MSDPASRTPRKRRAQQAVVAAPAVIIVGWIVFLLWQAGPLRTPPMPPLADQRSLLALARTVVASPGTALALPGVTERRDVRAAIVTAYFPGTPLASLTAWADVESGDIAAAVGRASGEVGREWEKRSRTGAGKETLRVDLTGPERRIRAIAKRPTGRLWLLWMTVPTHDIVLDPGIDGLVAREGERVWFAGPSTRVERSWSAQQATASFAKAAGNRPMRRFRAASFIEGKGGDPLTIVRGNVLPPYPATAAALRQASALGGHYLANKVEANGRFVYLFDAQEGRPEGDYNLLRHAGTLWAMFQVHGATGEPGVREAALRGLENLSREYPWRDPRFPEAIFLREGPEGRPKLGDVKLGACGLGILAYVEAERAGVVLSESDRALVTGLGHGILAMQKPDGELISYLTVAGRPPNPRRSVYYPGEAILALVELYNRDGNRIWLDGAMRAADFQIGPRWKYAGIEVFTPPDAWLTQALEKLWIATKEDRYRDYTYKLGDELLRTTFPPHANVPPDFRGATFTGKVVRATPTASRNEAVVAAARLAFAAGDTERGKRYLEGAQAAAWFGIAQQFRAENVHFVHSPEKALGGIRESITDNSVRIDGVQHAVSGFLGLADMMDPRPKVTGTNGGPS